MNRRVERNRAVQIILDAEHESDAKTAKRHRISMQTISKYRAMLRTDKEMMIAYLGAKMEQDRAWAAKIPGIVMEAMDFISRACQQGDPRDAGMVRAIAQAVETLGAFLVWRNAIDAKTFVELHRGESAAGTDLDGEKTAGCDDDVLPFRTISRG